MVTVAKPAVVFMKDHFFQMYYYQNQLEALSYSTDPILTIMVFLHLTFPFSMFLEAFLKIVFKDHLRLLNA